MVIAGQLLGCLLYTSDAADERSSVDLGGRRIIKKKKTKGVPIREHDLHNKSNTALRTQQDLENQTPHNADR